MSLVADVVDLTARSGQGRAETILATLYVGLAVGAHDATAAGRLLRQLEREMGAATGEPAEQIEVRLRDASVRLARLLDRHVEEP